MSFQLLDPAYIYGIYRFLSSHSFQFIILSHFVVQLLLHLVQKIGATIVLASSDVGVETIAVLGFDTKELVHGLRQVLELHIAIIHASHDADAIYHFYKVNGIASPFLLMALILMILAERLLKWMWSHEDDMLLPHALAFCGQMQ